VQQEKAVPADTAPTPAPSLAAADSYKEKADSPEQANKPARQIAKAEPKLPAPVPAPMAEVAKAAKTVAAEQQAEVADSTSAGLLSGKIAGVEVQDSNKHLNEVVIGYASQPKYDSVNGDLAGRNNGKVVIRGNSSLNETVVVRGVKAGKRPADEETSTTDYVSPVPVNGEAAYERYLKSNARNPDNVKGTVKVSFVVMPDGSLQDFRIKNHLSKECDEEAIRLIKEGPGWKPSSDGKPTRVTRKIRFVAGKNQE
jgi:outer membrane biosynthesis protein TonB